MALSLVSEKSGFRHKRLGKSPKLAGPQFYYLENQDSNSYFTVFIHSLIHFISAYWAHCVPSTMMGVGNIAIF